MAAGEVMGRVTAEASAWSGLPAGVPVTVAGHDHLVGFVGSGAGVDDLVDSVGTAETVVGRSAALPDIEAALGAGVAVGLFPGGDGWVALASAARSGQAVDAAAAALGQTPAELDGWPPPAASSSMPPAWSTASAAASLRPFPPAMPPTSGPPSSTPWPPRPPPPWPGSPASSAPADGWSSSAAAPSATPSWPPSDAASRSRWSARPSPMPWPRAPPTSAGVADRRPRSRHW